MSAYLKTPASVPSRMTVNEFLQWPEDPTGALWQLIDGEPVLMAPASDLHNAIQNNLGFVIEGHLRRVRPQCRVVPSPGIRPRVRRDHNVRIPDLAVTCKPARQGVHLTPDPMLAIEILSPSNEAETWSNIWTYCTIPSLKEIMVVHTAEMLLEILRRDADGSWPERFTPSKAPIELESIGLTLGLAEVYYEIVFPDA